MIKRRNTADSKSHWLNRVALYVVVTLVLYVLSSGPVMGLSFWLRETTHNDNWYLLCWLYYPLFFLGQDNLLSWYVEWWVVDVFQTVGPG